MVGGYLGDGPYSIGPCSCLVVVLVVKEIIMVVVIV